MARRFQKFKQVTAPMGGSRSETVTREISAPFLGMRPDKSRHELMPGESGDMVNFLVENGRLRNFPSTSSLTNYTLPTVPSSDLWANLALFAHPTQNEIADGNTSEYRAVAILGPQGDSVASVKGLFATSGWSSLPLNSAVSFNSSNPGYTTTFFRMPDIYSGGLTWMLTGGNPGLAPIVGNFDDFTSAITPLTNFTSVASGARLGAVFDARIIFAFESAANSPAGGYQQRIRWTARGTGTDFTSVGAGFKDLNEADGAIRVLHPQNDRLLILTAKELWQATPRRDDYAFDFNRIDAQAGCDNKRLLTDTPLGPVWLYNDSLIRLTGNSVRRLSPSLRHELSRYHWGAIDGDVRAITYSHARNALILFAGSLAQSSTSVYILELNTLRALDTGEDEANWTSLNVPLTNGVVGGEKAPTSIVVSPELALNLTDTAATTPFQNPWFIPWTSSNSTAIVHILNLTGGSNETAEFTTHIPEGSRDARNFDMLREIGLDYEVVGSSVSVQIGVSRDVGASYTTVGYGLMPSGRSHIDIALTPLNARNPIVKIAACTSGSSSTFYIDRMTFTGRAFTGYRGR